MVTMPKRQEAFRSDYREKISRWYSGPGHVFMIYAIGLSGRYSLEGRGMVFYYPGSQGNSGFWMKNTLLPLTAAFVTDDGTIVNLADMKPQSDDSHCSTQPVRFVLEMNQGWFAKRNIQAGYRLGGQTFAR